MKTKVIILLLLSALTIGSLQLDPQPYGLSGDWSLVFSDEFNGSSLDLTKWRPNWLGGSDTQITPPINTSEYNCYDPRQVSVTDGSLVLTVDNNNLGSACKTRSATAPYKSGMVQSNGHFNNAYGYYEARIWMPAGVDHKSVWPAFWTNGQSWPKDGEIDIVECYGTDESCSYHYHYYPDTGPGGNYTLQGSTAGWHVYAAYWEPGKITWYWDGIKVWQYTTGIISSPHYIILNLGTRGTQVVAGSQMLVDYVRVWKGTAGAPVTPQPTNTVQPTRTALPTATRTTAPTVTPIPPTIAPTFTNVPPTVAPTFTPVPPTVAPPTITPIPTDTTPYIDYSMCDPVYLDNGVCIIQLWQ